MTNEGRDESTTVRDTLDDSGSSEGYHLAGILMGYASQTLDIASGVVLY